MPASSAPSVYFLRFCLVPCWTIYYH